MTRRKHRNDKNHNKNGWVSGNPRYKRAKATQGKKLTEQAPRNVLGAIQGL